MSFYELLSTLTALLAVLISLVSLVRTRKITREQTRTGQQGNKLAALVALLSEYKSQIEILETALNDGTVERENLSHSGFERIIGEYEDKRDQAIQAIEDVLKSLENP